MIFEPGLSTLVELQAIGRAYRVEQEHTVRVLRLYLQDSWNEWEERNSLVKQLPIVMTKPNRNIFGAEEEDVVSLGDQDVSIRRYVVFDNFLVPAEERPMVTALSPEDSVKTVSRMLKDQRNFRSKERKELS
jgi:hypothetical protein